MSEGFDATSFRFFAEYGLTRQEWEAMTEAAHCIVNSGHKDILLRVFGNQIISACHRKDADYYRIFWALKKEFENRLNSP